MNKKPPNRPGITFEVGARVEAQDYLQKWYPSRIEKIDYEEGKMLVHFDRWSHRYDEWIYWDSNRLRPLERPALRKEGLKDEDEPTTDFRSGEEVLARWTDCRYYPAKIETLNKDGTYTVQFYDGVIRCLKKMHIKSMPEDAKGQDWIALVKAAAAAAKAKMQCKPRTSANSSKDKEERKELKVTPKKEGEISTSETAPPKVQKPEEEPLSSDSLIKVESVKEEPKSTPEVLETTASKKKTNSPGSSFLAKRARLNKITGLLASKAVVADSAEKKKEGGEIPQLPEQEKLLKTESQEKCISPPSSPQSQKTTLACTPFSSGKSRNRKSKAEPSDPSWSKRKPKSSITSALSQEEEIKLVPQFPLSETPPTEMGASVINPPLVQGAVNLCTDRSQAESPHRTLMPSHRRRRSQRLATVLPETSSEQVHSPSSSTDGKGLSSSPYIHQDPAILEESGATSVTSEKLEMVLPLDLSKRSKVMAPSSPPFTAPKDCIKKEEKEEEKEVQPDVPLSSNTVTEETVTSSESAAVVKGIPKTVKLNRHSREPIINTKKPEDLSSPKEPLIDLDHNKFKCKVPGCSKAFRKAKLLDYHLKYYHSTDKETESETGSPDRAVRTRATSATVPTSTPETQDAKRRRTVSGSSLALSSDTHALQLETPLTANLKLLKCNKKKRSSASMSSDGTDAQFSMSVKEKSFESLHDKILKKVIEKNRHLEAGVIKSEKKIKLEEKSPSLGKKKEKDKERKEKKEKDHFKVKQKKKKKKKKKSKQHDYSDYEENSMDFLDKCSLPRSLGNSVIQRNAFQMKNSSFQYPRAILSVDLSGENLSDMEFLDDSSTESLLLSGDEYNQDFDSTNLEESQDEEDATNEIVRCICEMDEENGFMIQCEECMCWQHSMCMGLLEESIPEHYICYVCRDPPGQRWSAKYRYDKDWLNKGHLYGLSFLNENYSHQNAKKIASTHKLLADVYSVTEVLHGLKLKIGILQNKQHPDLRFWACSAIQAEQASMTMGVEKGLLTFQEKVNQPENNYFSENHKVQPNLNLKTEDNYITSEHSYQKPQTYFQDHKPIMGPTSSDDDDSSSLDEEQGNYFGTNKIRSLHTIKQECLAEQDAAKGLPVTSGSNFEKREVEKQADSCLQWQLNLLNHIENIQNEVTTRMELIEKEVDVLESWLDFTGELEPPEPLARLPQLKRRIKQLLTDLGKVQQMATVCPV